MAANMNVALFHAVVPRVLPVMPRDMLPEEEAVAISVPISRAFCAPPPKSAA